MIPTPPTSHTTVTDLASGEWRDVYSVVRSGTWAALAKLAWPILEHHHGDLYHDAIYLDRLLPQANRPAGSIEFFYAVDDMGTALAFDRKLAEIRAGSKGKLWVVTLRSTPSKRWQLIITEDTRWRELA